MLLVRPAAGKPDAMKTQFVHSESFLVEETGPVGQQRKLISDVYVTPGPL